MRLFERMMTGCTLLERSEAPDGQGGRSVSWADGEPFEAALVLASSSEAQQGCSERCDNRYTVTTLEPLGHGDVFRRSSDGQVFRVTSNADDVEAPGAATFRLMQCQAEEWELPDA